MREILTLTMPLDPRLARLGGLAARHFLRHNGMAAGAARRRALQIEVACRRLLGGRSGPGRQGSAVRLRMVAHGATLEVVGRGTGRRPASLLRIPSAARPKTRTGS
jgi:hypothetical protein